MKTSKLIRKAIRRYLHDGHGPCPDFKFYCICYALEELSDRNQKHWPQVNAVQELIQQRLGDCSTVDAWLLNRVKGVSELFAQDFDYAMQQVQAYRRRWAESIADEFQAQGD